MYDAFPDLPAIYDSVPVYVNRCDVQFWVDEARSVAGDGHIAGTDSVRGASHSARDMMWSSPTRSPK